MHTSLHTSLALDDVVALFLTLNASDRSALKRVRSLLQESGADDEIAAAAISDLISALNTAIDAEDDVATEVLRQAEARLGEALEAPQEKERPRNALEEPQKAEPLPSLLPADTDTTLLAEFISESREYIQSSEQALLQLEDTPDDPEAVNTIFRAFHTIKGTSGFLGLTDVNHFAHHAESLLSAVRDQQIPFSRSIADLALQATDMLGSLMDAIEGTLPGSPVPTPPGMYELQVIIERASVETDTQAAVTCVPSGTHTGTAAPPDFEWPVATTAPQRAANPEAGAMPAGAVQQPASGISAAVAGGTTAGNQAGEVARASGNSTVRVRTERLDRLIDMMGELVIAQSMIAEDPVVKNDTGQGISRKAAHAGKIVRELQELSMSMRMVPLKATFHKMRRLVRDVAHRSGKHVDLIIEGEDTEIDRNMVDVIGDPLVHMVRNAIDHGIETPDVRRECGKPETGRLIISASHAGGSVVVNVSDDGKGLDRERILAKAAAGGLIEPDKAMSDSDIYNLIFAPGFSTNDEVTDLSGRGVGMDVVRTNIESIEGRIDIASDPGKGSQFILRLPLTLAVTDGMFVRVAEERFIIPTIHIQFSLRPSAQSLNCFAGQREMVQARGELLPLLRLHRLFGIGRGLQKPQDGMLVVVNVADRLCAVLVDEVLGQQQVVAKPMGEGIGRVAGVAGSAILGDGRVGLILDVPELISLANQPQQANWNPAGQKHSTVTAAHSTAVAALTTS